jgi:hypothetical protein
MPTKRSKPQQKKSKPPYERMRSGFEKKVAKCLEKKKVQFEYEKERLPYLVPTIRKVYTPDFLLPNGIVIEAKGNFDRASRKKMALVLEQHKDRDIRMLFMRDNPINKGSKTKYSDWCKERGIKFHISSLGEVPDEWLK